MPHITQIGPKLSGVLYHYTSQATLFNIVSTKSIWASHVSYMNDANEIRYAAQRALNIVNAIATDNIERSKLLNQLKNWLSQYLNPTHFIFSFSLSESGNLLSQWRAYTPEEAGVSIGFNEDELKLHANKYNFQLVKCIYHPQEQDQLLSNFISKLLHDFDANHYEIHKSLDGAPGQEYYKFLNGYAQGFLYEFAKIKDPLFSEEREWRLLSKYYNTYAHADIKFRASKTTLIPYVEFNLKDIRNDGRLFEQIYVGPSSNFNLSFNAVGAFIGNQNACAMTINSQQSIRKI